MRLGLVALAVLVTVGLGAPVRAEPTADEKAAARLLFDEGRKLAKAGKHGEACPKFEQAMKLDPGTGVLFNLADCWEHIGRTASAWNGFRDVAAQMVAAKDPAREAAARERASQLEPKLIRLVLNVPRDVSGNQVVWRDDERVARTLWGTPVPLDPGMHEVRATGSGLAPWRIVVKLADPGSVMTVDVPKLDAMPGGVASTTPSATSTPATTATPSATSTPATTATPATAAPTTTATAPPARTWQRPVGIAALGIGVVALGAGTAIGFIAKGKKNDSNADGHCVQNVCDAVGFELRDDAYSKGNLATMVFAAGAAVAVGGAVLWLTAPASNQPAVGLAPNGAVVRGSF